MKRRTPKPMPPPAVRLAHLIPPPERRFLTKPPQWAVGVMAAKRDSGASYVAGCVRSLIAAGFPEPIVFAEPGTPGIGLNAEGHPVVLETGTPATINGVRLGVFPNHLAMLTALSRGQQWQGANAFLIVEEDTVYTPGLRQYLDEYVLWPCDPRKVGALTLFTHSLTQISNRPPGWHQLTPDVFRHLWGGQALVMSREGVEAWLSSPLNTRHREHTAPEINRYPDSRLSEFCRLFNRPIYFPVGMFRDSPVDHIGHHSSVFGQGRNGRARRFAAETINAPLIVRLAQSGRPPKRRAVPLPESTADAAPFVVETPEERHARRLKQCQSCPPWKENRCTACKCNRPPSMETLGNQQLLCPRGLWGEVNFLYRGDPARAV